MNKQVDISDFGIEIMNTLESELEEIQESMDIAALRLAKELEGDITEDSPKDKGDYASGWFAKKKGHGAIVHNTKRPELTAILEFGFEHVRKGIRINGKPHIYKNAERICERFENECIAIVSEGVRYKK